MMQSVTPNMNNPESPTPGANNNTPMNGGSQQFPTNAPTMNATTPIPSANPMTINPMNNAIATNQLTQATEKEAQAQQQTAQATEQAAASSKDKGGGAGGILGAIGSAIGGIGKIFSFLAEGGLVQQPGDDVTFGSSFNPSPSGGGNSITSAPHIKSPALLKNLNPPDSWQNTMEADRGSKTAQGGTRLEVYREQPWQQQQNAHSGSENKFSTGGMVENGWADGGSVQNYSQDDLHKAMGFGYAVGALHQRDFAGTPETLNDAANQIGQLFNSTASENGAKGFASGGATNPTSNNDLVQQAIMQALGLSPGSANNSSAQRDLQPAQAPQMSQQPPQTNQPSNQQSSLLQEIQGINPQESQIQQSAPLATQQTPVQPNQSPAPTEPDINPPPQQQLAAGGATGFMQNPLQAASAQYQAQGGGPPNPNNQIGNVPGAQWGNYGSPGMPSANNGSANNQSNTGNFISQIGNVPGAQWGNYGSPGQPNTSNTNFTDRIGIVPGAQYGNYGNPGIPSINNNINNQGALGNNPGGGFGTASDPITGLPMNNQSSNIGNFTSQIGNVPGAQWGNYGSPRVPTASVSSNNNFTGPQWDNGAAPIPNSPGVSSQQPQMKKGGFMGQGIDMNVLPTPNPTQGYAQGGNSEPPQDNKMLQAGQTFEGDGKVNGPGGPQDDAIPAKLSNGEFVMSQPATQFWGVQKLNDMNEKGKQGFMQLQQQVEANQADPNSSNNSSMSTMNDNDADDQMQGPPAVSALKLPIQQQHAKGGVAAKPRGFMGL